MTSHRGRRPITWACTALGCVIVACGSSRAQSPAGHVGHEMHAPLTGSVSGAHVMVPPPVIGDIPLIDSSRQATSLSKALATDGAVFVNFIFTSCTTVCPVMSAAFAQFHDNLGVDRTRVRLVSISIDPQIDMVERLRAYAERHHAGSSWQFLTGTTAASEAAQRAFGAYRGDKTNHAPATYFRRTPASPWERIEGLTSARTLLAAYRGAIDR